MDRMESEIENVRQDIIRLNKKMIVAAQNEEKAAEYLLQLRSIKEQAEAELEELGTEKKAAHFSNSGLGNVNLLLEEF